MTRAEFLEDVTCFSDLINFCNDNGLSFCEEVYDEDIVNEWIDDSLIDLARNYSWGDVRDILNEYADNSGYDWYRYDESYGRYEPLGDYEFNEYRDEVLDYMDENGLWDEDDEEEEEEPFEDDEEFDLETDDCSMQEMMFAGVGCIRELNDAAIEQARQENRAFTEFFDGYAW